MENVAASEWNNWKIECKGQFTMIHLHPLCHLDSAGAPPDFICFLKDAGRASQERVSPLLSSSGTEIYHLPGEIKKDICKR